MALVAGGTALLAKKGHRLHRGAGNDFTLATRIMATSGARIAFRKPEAITPLVGLLTTCLLASSWLTVRGAFERGRLLPSLICASVALALAAAFLHHGLEHHGLEARHGPSGLKDGFPPEPHFFFALVALLPGVLDARALVGTAANDTGRVTRHLWRMSFALLLATASFFGGPGAQPFPEPLQGSPLLLVPQLAMAIALVFWLVRVLHFKRVG